MPLLRRFLVLAALLFWQGGFTFYTAVVIPVGFTVLGSHRRQAAITVEVTRWLNVTAVVALLVLNWEAFFAPAAGPRWRRWRAALWALMAAIQVALFVLHPHLAAQFDPRAQTITDEGGFHLGHRVYVWISTVQWACGLAFLGGTLWSWRQEDRGAVAGGPVEAKA